MTNAEKILSTMQLTLSTAVLSARVERDRMAPFQVEELPAVVIRPKREDSTPIANQLLRCTLDVDVEVHVRGATPSLLADPIAETIHAALSACPSLSGLISKMFRAGKDWEFSDSDGLGGKLVITYQIHHIEPA